ncbi:unnamed protein product [Linum trigynum]|uniref:Cysteine proteinase inhibitor n=1 Tax=Linum trigynum TaxID=586398 RepID=A0AAV2EJD6_9ROSI
MMTKKPAPFLLVAIAVVAKAAEPAGGEWLPLQDPKAKHVKDMAEFAVSVHNDKYLNDPLDLYRVDGGEYQKLSDGSTNYRLRVVTVGDESSLHPSGIQNWTAILHEMPSGEVQLVSFEH